MGNKLLAKNRQLSEPDLYDPTYKSDFENSEKPKCCLTKRTPNGNTSCRSTLVKPRHSRTIEPFEDCYETIQPVTRAVQCLRPIVTEQVINKQVVEHVTRLVPVTERVVRNVPVVERCVSQVPYTKYVTDHVRTRNLVRGQIERDVYHERAPYDC